VGHLSVDEQTEMRSVILLIGGAPMAFVQLHQMTVAHPQRTQNTTQFKLWCVVHFSINTSFTKVQVSSIMDGTSDMKEMSGRSHRRSPRIIEKREKTICNSKLHLNSDSSRSNILPYQSAC
jgi:hypothetical protein